MRYLRQSTASGLVFVVFFGRLNTEPDRDTGWRMALPLTVLCGLSLIGGYFIIPVQDVFPVASGDHPAHWVEYVSISVPLIGVAAGLSDFSHRPA